MTDLLQVDRPAGIAERLRAGQIVKICGLRRSEDAVVAAMVGADLIGFIFARARRRIEPEAAREAIDAARAAVTGGGPLAVGVFVDATAEEMNRTADAANLDLLQLHGSESPALLADLERPVIKAFRPHGDVSVSQLERDVAPFAVLPAPPVAYLIDGFSEREAGGEGVRADWSLAAEVSQRLPAMLAGGLNAANVGNAIDAVDPIGVDVSSGVEVDGVKDPRLIEAFVKTARSAFLQRRAVVPVTSHDQPADVSSR